MAEDTSHAGGIGTTEEAAPDQHAGRRNYWPPGSEQGIPQCPHPHPSKLQSQGGRLLSSLLALNILFLGGVLVCGGVFSEVPVHQEQVLVMLTIMMVLAGVWMGFYMLFTARQKQALPYKDSHAAPVWLRAGLLVLGACTLLLDIFRLVRAAGSAGCEHPIKILFPCAEIMFVFTQSYFLCVHSKDCAQVQQGATRCGLTMTLVTNLMLWMSAVAEESLHHTGGQGADQSQVLTAAAAGDCLCSTQLCRIVQTGSSYLYPFSIEYSLFACMLCGEMWRNVGQVTDRQQHANVKLRLGGTAPGLVLGAALLLAGLAVFVIYEVEVSDRATRTRGLLTYYTFNCATLSLMCISCLVGCLAHRLGGSSGNHSTGPARSLDEGLLVAAALGQYLISYFSAVALVWSQCSEPVNVLNLLSSLLTIVQLTLQNIFILGSLRRLPVLEGSRPGVGNPLSDPPTPASPVYTVSGASRSFPEAVTERSFQRSSPHSHRDSAGSVSVPESVASSRESRQCPQPASPHTLERQPRILRVISSFLLLCNVLLWAMSAFGARPQFANGIEEKFYGFQMWAAIVNSGLPVGIFYRMHSAASLLEISLTS
ncbi:proton channel OTOP2-like [Pristis pectinata]|uniref:proton channel OTOP2-like n=1 Tax=Pristis pectinata TaxID=685728 RepID=UPI00223DF0FB|nr:proton channel OTOP2-like [Pristis pectinata]